MSNKDNSKNDDNPLNNLFDGLGKFINIVSDMSITGENVKKYTGEINGLNNNKIKSAYDFSVKLGLNDDSHPIRTFSKNKYTEAKVEPNVDIFDEEEELSVIILVNNINESDIKIQPKGKGMIFEARNANIHYYKEIDLPFEPELSSFKWNYKNGIISISIPKQV